MGITPHALLIPFPAQGHVLPLMELARRLADAGVLVTFVNTERNHAQLMAAARPQINFRSEDHAAARMINLVAMPDGFENTGAERSSYFKTIQSAMPNFLEELILRINKERDDEHKITWVIADGVIAWLLDVAKKLNLRTAAFWPTSVWVLAVIRSIPRLIDSGVIDQNGFLLDGKLLNISDGLPAMNPVDLCWLSFGNTKQQSAFFKHLCDCVKSMEGLDCILCNSFTEIEGAEAFKFTDRVIPIGPLVSSKPAGYLPKSFWKEDFGCIGWLDRQPIGSVVYVSFGSVATFRKEQIDELALGLELTGKPFLWVCRPDLMRHSSVVYPDGFIDRVGDRGRIVEWAPQREVLSHPSVSCFLTHCGWNSTMEGIACGVPLLCLPYFTDQFLNRQYIVDVWKVGLELVKGDKGIVMKEEISAKLEEIIHDEGIRKRVLEQKERGNNAVMDGGLSSKNLDDFISTMKAG